MKSFLGLVLVAIFIVVLPAFALAQDTLVVDINYFGGDHEKVFSYEPFLKDGGLYAVDGTNLSAKLRLGDDVAIGYRRERVDLTNAFNTIEGANYERRVTRDIVFHDGSAKYREFFGSFKLPKTHGHSLVLGVTKNTFNRSWQYGSTKNNREDSFNGLVLGAEGQQKVGKLSFNYSGRWYPRLNEKVTSKVTSGSHISDEELPSSGYELRGTATWAVTKHFGLTGGYEFRQFQANREGRILSFTETQMIKGFLVGTRLSF